MAKKPTYEELEQRVNELEKEALERKRVEEELRENSARYRTLLETADDAIVFKDSEGLYVEVNKEFLRRLGLSNEEIIGKTAQDVYTKEVGAKIFENDLEVLKTGRLQEFEDRYPTPEGTTIVSLARKVPIRDESGKVVGLLAIARDITARKRAEEKLGKAHDELERRVEERTAALAAANEQLKREIEEHKRSEEEASYERDLMQTLLNNIPDYIYFKDKNRRFVRASNSFCDLFGCSMEDIIGKKDEDLFPEEVAKETVSDDRHVIETGTPLINKEEFGESIGGEDHWVLTTKLPWRDKDDNIIGLFGISREITDRKKVEKALSQSEDRYRSVVERSIQGITILQDNIIQFANQATAKIFGYNSQDEIVGNNLWETLVDPEEWAELQARSSKILSGKLLPVHAGWKGICKDGKRIWVQSTASLISWQDRPASLAIYLDVTELKKSEEALRESEEFNATLLENSPNPILVANPDTSIRYVNPALEQTTGFSSEELIGRKPPYPFWTEETLDMTHKDFGEAFKKGARGLEKVFQKKNGERFWVEINTTRVITNGEFKYHLANWSDITDRKQAEDDLRQSEERYRSVVEDSIHGIIIFKQGFNIQFVNQAAVKMFGFDKTDELVGLNSLERLVAPEYHSEIQGRVADLEDGKFIPTHPGWQGIRKDGTRIWVQSTGCQHLWQGQPAVLAYLLDITDYKKAEEEKRRLEAQLQQAQRMESIGTLAGGLAHNFNNLLMSIIGNSSIMLLDIDSNHPHYKNLKNIEKNVHSGAKVTKQLLGYAREGKYEVRPFNMNQLVKETSDTFGATRKEVRVHQDLSDMLFGIKADQGQIEQVLMNLYINAADAMPGGGDLFIKTKYVTDKDMKYKPYEPKQGNYILLTVRDTGVGMDEKTMDRIFDPFFTTKGLAEGTGLGLASAYGIIKAHSGYIDVDSEEGKGTTFEIYLPATEEEGEKEKELPDELVKGEGTVLLVDDEEMVLEAGEQMVKTLGYKVLSSTNSQEALELYKKNQDRIEIVLLDMVMPGVGGGKTFDRLKEINPRVKVLLLSGYSIDGQATEILKRGCDGFIQKPFSLKQLSQSIRKILDKGNMANSKP